MEWMRKAEHLISFDLDDFNHVALSTRDGKNHMFFLPFLFS